MISGLSDEVYADLAYAGPHVSPWSLPGMAERTVVVSSLSKSHAVPGFRPGWIIGLPQLTTLAKLVLCMLYGGPPFIQAGALAALTQDCPEVAEMAEAYQRRAAIMVSILKDVPGLRAGCRKAACSCCWMRAGPACHPPPSPMACWMLTASPPSPATASAPVPGHLRISLAAP